MTIMQIFGFLLVVAMMFLVYIVTRFVASAEYEDKGIWHITIRAYFWKDKKYIDWVKENRVYEWSTLLVVCLIVTILSLIPPFSKGVMFVRPELVMVISPILYLSIAMIYRWFAARVN